MPDITSPTFKADPFPFYAQLRRESPVHEVMLPGRQRAWLVTRYADVLALLKDERFVKSRANVAGDGSYREPRERAVLYVDGRLDRVIENASEPCAGATYTPFPDLQGLTR